MQKLERDVYLYYYIYQYIPKTLREMLNRWFPGLTVNRFRFRYGVGAGRIRTGYETLPEFDIVFRRV